MIHQMKSFFSLMKSLLDKKSCREFLEEQRWNGVPVCPHCGCIDEHHYKLTFFGEFNGLYKCRHCRKRFTVTTGTMFESSNIPLDKWFYAIYMFLSHKKGISSLQLSRDIEVTQKTAWFMLNRIRHNLMREGIGNHEGIVQVDETYIGGKSKGRFKFNRGRSMKQKIPVVGLLSDDKIHAYVVSNTKGSTLEFIIAGLVEDGTTVVTDSWGGYHYISDFGYTHEVVEHGIWKYVNERGFHTNGIEGFWSHLKRGLKGIYHSVRPKHPQMYCDEFTYRYNTRKMDDIQRFLQFLTKPSERVRYSELICGFI